MQGLPNNDKHYKQGGVSKVKECIVRYSGSKYHICGYKPERYKGEKCFLLFDKTVSHLVEVDDFIIRFGRKFKYYVEVKNSDSFKKRRYFTSGKEVYDYFYKQVTAYENRKFHVTLFGRDKGSDFYHILLIR